MAPSPTTSFAIARIKQLRHGPKNEPVDFCKVRVPVESNADKSYVTWCSSPIEIKVDKTFQGEKMVWKPEWKINIELLAAKAPLNPKLPTNSHQPPIKSSVKNASKPQPFKDFVFCSTSINVTELLTKKGILPIENHHCFTERVKDGDCEILFRVEVSPSSENVEETAKKDQVRAFKDDVPKYKVPELLLLNLDLACPFQEGWHVAIVPEQTDEPIPCSLFHRKSIFVKCPEDDVHRIGTVTKVQTHQNSECIVVHLKLLNPKAWRDSGETALKGYCQKLKNCFDLSDERIYCVFCAEKDAADDDEVAARHFENERFYQENQGLKTKVIKEKGDLVTLTSMELGTVVLRTGFLLAQPVISSIVLHIMDRPSLGLSGKEKNCLNMFGSKDGPWDIFYMFKFLKKLFNKTNDVHKNIFGLQYDDGEDVRVFVSHQETIKRILDKIYKVRNWWAHVGVSFFDCLNALIALKDFIHIATHASSAMNVTPVTIDESLVANFNQLSRIIDELRGQYSCHGSVSLSVDELSHLYIIRAFRTVVETCNKELDIGEGAIRSNLAQDLQDLREKKSKLSGHRQSDNLEVQDVARVVKNFLQSQKKDTPKGTILDDCDIIIKARNILAHEPQQSGRVLAVLCALGSIMRLLQFIIELSSCDDTRKFGASGIVELRYYQVQLLFHIGCHEMKASEGIFDIPGLIRRVCLSHTDELVANCIPGKEFIFGDIQKFQFLLDRRISISKSSMSVQIQSKTHRKLMHIAARVPSCHKTAEEFVEWLYSTPAEKGFLKYDGLELAEDMAKLLKNAAQPSMGYSPTLHSCANESVWGLRALAQIDSFTAKLAALAIQGEMNARNEHVDAMERFEEACLHSDGCHYERPSTEDQECWNTYLKSEVSEQLRDNVQITRNALSEKKRELEYILGSENIRQLKASLVGFIYSTIASILDQSPHHADFLHPRLPGSRATSWEKLQELLPFYFGSKDSESSITIHSICNPSTCYPFLNIFGRKCHKPLFASGLKILAPLLDCHIANLNLHSEEHILQIEACLGSNYFDGLVYLACLSSKSFQHEMIEWYDQKSIKTRIFGSWGFLSAIGCGDDKFTGREAELKSLEAWVGPLFECSITKQSARSLVILISGEPGMGKTTLAEHFLNKIQNDFFSKSPNVFAFSFQGCGIAAVQDGLKHMASIILPVQEDAVQDSLTILKEFLSHHCYVLFVDDVDESGLKELMFHAPVSRQGSIIILTSYFVGLFVADSTNSDPDPQKTFLFQQIQLEKFSRDEALEVVRKVCEPSKYPESFESTQFQENLDKILGGGHLNFLPIGVRIFAKWLKRQLKANSRDPLQQWIVEFDGYQEQHETGSFEGYRGLKTTVKLCAARLEELIRKRENCEGTHESCDALKTHFGMLWLLSMCKPVQTPYSFFCVPEGELVRGSMVIIGDEGAFEDMNPLGEYVRVSKETNRSSSRFSHDAPQLILFIGRVIDDKIQKSRRYCDKIQKSCRDDLGSQIENFIRVRNVDDGKDHDVLQSEFTPCDAEVVIVPVEEAGCWKMRSVVDFNQFRSNWLQAKNKLRTDPEFLGFHPIRFLRDDQNFVLGRVIRYHRNPRDSKKQSDTVSVQFVLPTMPVPGPLSDRIFESQEFSENFPSVGRFPVKCLHLFQPERDLILHGMKIDVVSFHSSINSVAQTLQKSGLVRVDKRKFDMHQLIQRAVHETFYGPLRYFSDNCGIHLMKSLVTLQFGSPWDEISYTKRRLTHIMSIIDTAQVVIKHQDFSRFERCHFKGLLWQEAILMRLHEISILASSKSSVSTIQLIDTAKFVLNSPSENTSGVNTSLLHDLLENSILKVPPDVNPIVFFKDITRGNLQWSLSLLLHLDERQTPVDRQNALSAFDSFFAKRYLMERECDDATNFEWIVYASNLFMLRGDREFEQKNCPEDYRHRRLGVRMYIEEELQASLWCDIEDLQCFKYWKEALLLRLDCLGINHPYTARAYHRIARAFLDLDMPHPAIPLLHSAKLIFNVSICDESHFEIGSIHCDLGRAFELLLPRFQKHEPASMAALFDRLSLPRFPRDKFGCLSDENDRRSWDVHEKWFKDFTVEDVQSQFKRALELQKESSNSLDVAITLSFSGRFEAHQGNYDRAIENLEKALRIQKDLIATHHFELHDNRFVLFLLYGIKGNETKAEAHYQDAVLDRTEYNKMQAWSQYSLVAISVHSSFETRIIELMSSKCILEQILLCTQPNLFRRDENRGETFRAFHFAQDLSTRAMTWPGLHSPLRKLCEKIYVDLEQHWIHHLHEQQHQENLRLLQEEKLQRQ